MDPSVATSEAPPTPAKDPHLPPLVRIGDLIAPKAPQDIATAGLEEEVLIDLAVKMAGTIPQFTTEWMSQRLQLSAPLVQELLEQLSIARLVEALWETGSGGNRYKITDRGREHAGAFAGKMRLCGPGAGPPGGLRGDAALAVRAHAAGAA